MYRNYCVGSSTLQYLYSPSNYHGSKQINKLIHRSPTFKYPQVNALKLPTNVININEAEIGRFSPIRVRDISGPIIKAHENKNGMSRIDITLQTDPHVNKYDCRGAVSLSSSMQSNVPSPFSGNNTHLGMPGSQWGQGYKYLSDHLHNAHYLSLRHKYQGKKNKDSSQNEVVKQQPTIEVSVCSIKITAYYKCIRIFTSIVWMIGVRKMSTDTTNNTTLSAKDKLKKAVKDYGATVIVFHVTISLISLGSCYLLVSSGVDVVAVLQYFNIGEGSQASAVASNAGTFVIAYGIHKVFAPARIAITLTATPFIVRYLRRIGVLKNTINGGGK